MSSSTIQYALVGNGDGTETITVFVPGSKPQVAMSDNPNFSKIKEKLYANDPTVVDLFDLGESVIKRFDAVTERMSYAGGNLFFDGDVVDNALANLAVRALEADTDEWIPLVNFYEKVQQNPNEHSRRQLFDWLNTHSFVITDSGDIVGYKGIDRDGKSIHSGKAIVNGEVVTGRIPNQAGSVIEMPRSDVQHDPSQGCHTGLHVGTWDYASTFGRGTTLEVHVNPRDVVSVPTDCDWAKMRVCRYRVVKAITTPYTGVVVSSYEDDRLAEAFAAWGDGEDDGECYWCDNEYDDCDGSCGV